MKSSFFYLVLITVFQLSAHQVLAVESDKQFTHFQKVVKTAKERFRRAMSAPHERLWDSLSPQSIRRAANRLLRPSCVRLDYAQDPAPSRLPQMTLRLFGKQF